MHMLLLGIIQWGCSVYTKINAKGNWAENCLKTKLSLMVANDMINTFSLPALQLEFDKGM